MPQSTLVLPTVNDVDPSKSWRKIVSPPVLWGHHSGSPNERDFGSLHFYSDEDRQPRHRHTMDQIRYIVSGEVGFGGGLIASGGDLGYFPEAVYYGPIVYKTYTETFNLQWPGPSAYGKYYFIEDLQKAMEQVMASGATFDRSRGGICVYPDGREQDSYEAIAEFSQGAPLQYAEPRYERPILVRGAQLPARGLNEDGTARIKHYGYFAEEGPNVKLIELDAGASVGGGTSNSEITMVVLSGAVAVDDQPAGPRAIVYTPPDATISTVRAEQPTTVLAVCLQALDGRPMPFSEFS